MPGEVDKLQVKIEADAQQAFKNVDALVGRLRELARMTGTVAYTMKRVGEGFNSFKAPGQQAAQTVNKITYNFKTIVKDANNAGKSMSQMKGKTENTTSAFTRLYTSSRNFLQFFSRINTITRAVGKAFSIMTAPIRLALSALRAVGNVVKTVGSAMFSFASRSVGAVGSAFKKASQLAHSLGNAFGAVVKKAKSVASSIASLAGAGFGALSGALKGAIGRVTGFFKGIMRIAKYRAIKAAIKAITSGLKEGSENLYYFSQSVGSEFAPAMDRLATSMLYLKNGFAAMFSPLVEYFAPYIDQFVDAIVEAFNWVQRLFAQLTGKSTWNKAIRVQTQWKENTDDTTESVKKLRQEIQLMDFDELNNITENPNNDNGKKGEDEKNPDPTKMFTIEQTGLEEMDGTIWENIKKKLVDWFESIGLWDENGFNWYQLGSYFGDAVNWLWETFSGWWNAIKWDKILANGLSFLDGLLDKIGLSDWIENGSINFGAIGTDIGNYIVDTWHKFTTWWSGINWDEIFKGVKDFFNGLLSALLPAEYFKPDGSLDWDKLGTTILDALSSIWHTITAWAEPIIGEIDLTEIGGKIGEAIGEWIHDQDWEGIWNGIKDTVQNVWDFVSNFTSRFVGALFPDTVDGNGNIDLNKLGYIIGSKIGEWLKAVPWGEIFKGIIGILEDIYKFLSGLIDGLLDELIPGRKERREAAEEQARRAEEELQRLREEQASQINNQGQGDHFGTNQGEGGQFGGNDNGAASAYQKIFEDIDKNITTLVKRRRSLEDRIKALATRSDGSIDQDSLDTWRSTWENRGTVLGASIHAEMLATDESYQAYARLREEIESVDGEVNTLSADRQKAAVQALVAMQKESASFALVSQAAAYSGSQVESYYKALSKTIPGYIGLIAAQTIDGFTSADWASGGEKAMEKLEKALRDAGVDEEMIPIALKAAERFAAQQGWVTAGTTSGNKVINAVKNTKIPDSYKVQAEQALKKYLNDVDWANGGKISADDIKMALMKGGVPGEYATLASRSIYGFLTGTYNGTGWEGTGDAVSKLVMKAPLKGLPQTWRQTAQEAIQSYVYGVDWANGGKASATTLEKALVSAGVPAKYAKEAAASAAKWMNSQDWVKAGVASVQNITKGANAQIEKTTLKKMPVTMTVGTTTESLGKVANNRIGEVKVKALSVPVTIPTTQQDIYNNINGKVHNVKVDPITIPVGFSHGRIRINVQDSAGNITDTRSATFAMGGYPRVGTMFVAGEAGAEFVGNINGRTGVASGQEITGIGDAVWSTGNTTASLLEEILVAVKEKNLTLSPSAALGRTVAQSQRLYARQTG